MPPPRRQGELLGGQDVVGLGDPGGITGQRHRPVMERGVAGGHAELLGGEDVAGRLAVQGRVRGGHAELLGGEDVVGRILAMGALAWHRRR